MALRLIEHDVAQKPSRAKICVAVQNGAHQIGCAEQALHQEIGFAARDAGDGLLRTCSVGIRIDDAEFRRSFAELFQKRGDLVAMADQNRLRDVLALGGADGPTAVFVTTRITAQELWGLCVKVFSNVVVVVLNYVFSKLIIFKKK